MAIWKRLTDVSDITVDVNLENVAYTKSSKKLLLQRSLLFLPQHRGC
jgi:hypothetical protein